MEETENRSNLLRLRDYNLSLNTEKGPVQVLNKINITLNEQETVGLVGESGCGKSMTALSMMGLLSNKIISEHQGELLWRGENLSDAGNSHFATSRGCHNLTSDDLFNAGERRIEVLKEYCYATRLVWLPGWYEWRRGPASCWTMWDD